MDAYLSRFDVWHVVLTATPLVAGSLLALLVTRWPRRHIASVALYAAICISVGVSPLWLRSLELVPSGPLRSVLVETKFAFFVGLAILFAAGGRAIEQARERQSLQSTGRTAPRAP